MPKNRYYYFDHTTCSFVEVRPHPLRRLLVLASLVVFLLGAGGFSTTDTTRPKSSRSA